jgi:hypothetical protein
MDGLIIIAVILVLCVRLAYAEYRADMAEWKRRG